MLLVCTANICRSPSAAGLLSVLAERASTTVEIASRGLLPGGRPAPPQVVRAMAPFGVDLADHRSIQLTLDDLSMADVVVTMTRQHLREVVLQLPDVWARTFTLLELVRRGEESGPRVAGQTMAEWFGEVHRGRRRQDMVGTARHEDVSDPYGGPNGGYRRMAVELADLMDRLAILLWQAGPIDPSEVYRLPSPP